MRGKAGAKIDKLLIHPSIAEPQDHEHLQTAGVG